MTYLRDHTQTIEIPNNGEPYDLLAFVNGEVFEKGDDEFRLNQLAEEITNAIRTREAQPIQVQDMTGFQV